jgi:TRAP-type mannitol/chloroaromatic compound transport system permease small subunit
MKALLGLSRVIDAINERVGKIVLWLVLASVLISATNAVVRKAFDMSSNAFLEIQWYLFAAVFLLASGYTLLNNEHVRIDVLTSHMSDRKRNWIDVIGLTLFLLPFSVLTTTLSIPYFYQAFLSGEVSSNAGGLIRWPVYLLIPVGFALLGIQGISELIKRIAFLRGLIPDPTRKKVEKSAEEELAEFVRSQQEKAGAQK